MGAADTVSVVIRHRLVQLRTPDAMRGRVGAVNYLFINASNQLGEFESGMTAALFGAVPAAVLGGLGSIGGRAPLDAALPGAGERRTAGVKVAFRPGCHRLVAEIPDRRARTRGGSSMLEKVEIQETDVVPEREVDADFLNSVRRRGAPADLRRRAGPSASSTASSRGSPSTGG